MTTSRTYAVLELTKRAFDEIKSKLEAAGYQDQFHERGSSLLIDMHGIGVKQTRLPEGSRFHDARALRLELTELIGPQEAEVAADIEAVLQRALEQVP